METLTIILQLFFAALLGALVGLEREIKGKNAGFQTYSLVCLGACLFTILFYFSYTNFSSESGVSFDPGRIIQAIAIGIGFLGAGVIFKGDKDIKGLTTAAGLWLVAGVGISVAFEQYAIALVATILEIVIFSLLGMLERKIPFSGKSSKKKK